MGACGGDGLGPLDEALLLERRHGHGDRGLEKPQRSDDLGDGCGLPLEAVEPQQRQVAGHVADCPHCVDVALNALGRRAAEGLRRGDPVTGHGAQPCRIVMTAIGYGAHDVAPVGAALLALDEAEGRQMLGPVCGRRAQGALIVGDL